MTASVTILDVEFARFRRDHHAWYDRWVFRPGREILDEAPESPAAVRVITDLERFCAASGLTRLLVGHLGRRLRHLHAGRRCDLRVLEMCAGGGGLARALARWGAQAGIPLEVVAVDHSAEIVRVAREKGDGAVRFVVGDATRLAWEPGSFDLVINAQSLHHFDPQGVVALLREAARVGRGLFFFDLRRTIYGAAMLTLCRPFFSAEFIHDGVISHRRAYSVAELRWLSREAGLDAEVRRFLPAGLALETGGAP